MKTDRKCKVVQIFSLSVIYDRLMAGYDVFAIHYDDDNAPIIKDLKYESFDSVDSLSLSREWVFITFDEADWHE